MQQVSRHWRRAVAVLLSGCLATCAWSWCVPCSAEEMVTLRGEVRDAASGAIVPARVYVKNADGKYFIVKSAAADGSAVEYQKVRGEQSFEIHTTISAHPFEIALPPGKYVIEAERGKEYLTGTTEVELVDRPVEAAVKLRRWINLAERGWYSGDTHVHRPVKDLPNLMLAEDLNVALPLTRWVTVGGVPPSQTERNQAAEAGTKLIEVDKTHVIYPINTEYEIGMVGGRKHTLGAVFVLNHKTDQFPGAPPVAPVAAQARAEGALLDLDKHSWPWSLMLVPVMKVDLFELSNNHVWRTEFFFRAWLRETTPHYQQLDLTPEGDLTEWGWIDYGMKTYYALLNCGFRMRPSAGTASGVHPVPLGYSRVYVAIDGEFSYDKWIAGLAAGRSFASTGPMLLVSFNAGPPGQTIAVPAGKSIDCRITGVAESPLPLERIEIVVNGQPVKSIPCANDQTAAGGYSSAIGATLPITSSSWVAVRCFQRRPGGRVQFAHTAPVHVDIANAPLRPRKAEVQWLIQRMEQELAGGKDALAADALDEYRQAMAVYRDLLERAQ